MSDNEAVSSIQKQNSETTGYVRCKVCGYVTHSGAVKEFCPACGVKAGMFEPLTEKFAENRRKFLDLHIHPIIVHFPQAFAITILLAVIGSLIFSGIFQQLLLHSTQLLSYAMPFVLILSFISGIKDGKVRYKKLGAPFLKLKVRLGFIYFFVSLINALCAFQYFNSNSSFLIPLIICAVIMVVFTSVLGKIGAELGCAKMPG